MLCEGACVRLKDSGEAVAIGQLQRHATDAFLDDLPSFFPPASRPAPAEHKSIAVVGAGPSGLACAHTLALHGHAVTIFEARAWPGGLSAHGVAPYKVADGIVEREIAALLRCGTITLQLNTMVGRDISLDVLREHHGAVFLGVGLQGSRMIEPHEAIHGALGVIEALRRNHMHPRGQHAVVIGGGMTAIDLAVELKMLGFAEVTICHRGPSLRASAKEQALAREHGVHIRLHTKLHGMAPHEAGGWLVSLHTPHVPDHQLRADHVFAAIGQQLFSLDEPHNATLALLAHDEQGLILVDEHHRTTLPGVFAGGDCIANSANLTVAAVADGQHAARAIIAHLADRERATNQKAEATLPT
jgi:glutamate synthase (NADPH/NADH) small chain